MIKVLPLKAIWPEDRDLFGEDIVDLARIYHLKLPLCLGLAFSAPEKLPVKTIDSSSEQIRLAIGQLPVPEDLGHMISQPGLRADQLWREIVSAWLEEFDQLALTGKGVKLSSKYCLFAGRIEASGQVYFDPKIDDSRVIIRSGQLTSIQLKQLDDYSRILHQKIVPGRLYDWILDMELKFVKVSSITEIAREMDTNIQIVDRKTQKELPKVATKIFGLLDQDLVIDARFDGFLVKPLQKETLTNIGLTLVESASSFPDKLVIDCLWAEDGEGGAANWLNLHQSVLERQVEMFLIARNKKRLTNLAICLPVAQSVTQFQALKRSLEAIGVSRRGSLQLWWQIGSPENLINFDSYARVGLDGVILDLDRLQRQLLGIVESDVGADLTPTSALEIFLKTYLKNVVRVRVRIIAVGRLAEVPAIIDLLMSVGAWGVAGRINQLEMWQQLLIKAEAKRVK